jgi:phage terminase large subunit-like protein
MSKYHERLLLLLQKELKARKAETEQYCWDTKARASQKIPEGDWKIWLILAGRGFGKTRTGAETVRTWATGGIARRICLIGHHMDDVRRVMVEGESGILSISHPQEGVRYEPSKRTLIWPNGAMALTYSGESPRQLRGPQFDAAWVDELAKFSHAQETWDQLMLCLRLGSFPRVIVTTTPKPHPLLTHLLKRSDVVVTRGNSFENQDNLPDSYLEELKKTYLGTRLGAQEVEGMILEHGQNALWNLKMLQHQKDIPPLKRIVVAIDPAVTHKEKSNETGIIVAGCDEQGKGYILEDLSGVFSPIEWVERAVEAYHHFKADRIIAEVNNGGDLVEHLLHTRFPMVPYRAVYATRGKMMRAEPIAALYEQGRIIHQKCFSALEEQLLSASHRTSPDRLDALVWALTELFFTSSPCLKISML